MALIVLGAGATRGAEFVGKQNSICQPPLNTDFFTQIQRIFEKKYARDISSTLRNTCLVFGTNFNLTMEELFTQIEFMLRAFRFVKVGTKRLETIKILEDLRACLFQSIFAVMEKSVHQSLQQGIYCKYHTNLINSLSKDDTIISFNYDCLIDMTLRKFGRDKWDPTWGYCFPKRHYSYAGFDEWKNEDKIQTTKNNTIKLLKVHGSINWGILEPRKLKSSNEIRRGRIHLRERLWGHRGRARFSIIPPEWNKDIAQEGTVYNKIWAEATKRIRKEDTFIFIGFSFTPTDLHAASLFQVAVNKLKRLIIVNPDKDARYRTRKILSKGISEKTKIIQFNKFGEFAESEERIRSCLKSTVEPESLHFGESGKETSKMGLPSDMQKAQQNENEGVK